MSLSWTVSTTRCRILLRVVVYAITSTTAFHIGGVRRVWRWQAVDYGMKTSSRTVLVVSAQFTSEIWPVVSDMKSLNDITRRLDTSVVVVLTESSCHVPRRLLDLATVVDASCHYDQWWQKLSGLLITAAASHDGISNTLYKHRATHNKMICRSG